MALFQSCLFFTFCFFVGFLSIHAESVEDVFFTDCIVRNYINFYYTFARWCHILVENPNIPRRFDANLSLLFVFVLKINIDDRFELICESLSVLDNHSQNFTLGEPWLVPYPKMDGAIGALIHAGSCKANNLRSELLHFTSTFVRTSRMLSSIYLYVSWYIRNG